jgi:Ca2+-binding EF-hand superfamily protein
MKFGIYALLSFIICLPVSAQAQDDKTIVQDWLVRQMVLGGGAPLNLAAAESRMRSTYAILAARSMSNQNAIPRGRAQQIARFLEKDLDNDGIVTRDELKEFFGSQAARPLSAASGVNVNPTREQVDSILEQLLVKELEADENGDGNIDFAEMRQYAAEKSAGNRRMQLNLYDPTVLRVLDTSGDKSISEAELVAGTRQAFEAADANKDGLISREELLPRIVPRFGNTF